MEMYINTLFLAKNRPRANKHTGKSISTRVFAKSIIIADSLKIPFAVCASRLKYTFCSVWRTVMCVRKRYFAEQFGSLMRRGRRPIIPHPLPRIGVRGGGRRRARTLGAFSGAGAIQHTHRGKSERPSLTLAGRRVCITIFALIPVDQYY